VPGNGFGADASSVGLDDRTRDCETEPAAAPVSTPAAVDAVEALEDPVELVGRDSGSGVADRDVKLTVVAVREDRDPIAALGVGNGVADEVAEHLGEAVGIGLERAVDRIESKVAVAE
jgi:hypothetical protein